MSKEGREELVRCFLTASDVSEYSDVQRELVERYRDSYSEETERVVDTFLEEIDEYLIRFLFDGVEGEDILIEDAKKALELCSFVKIELYKEVDGLLVLYVNPEVTEYYLVGSGREFGGESIAKFV
jgi:beta-galactosidase GanA